MRAGGLMCALFWISSQRTNSPNLTLGRVDLIGPNLPVVQECRAYLFFFVPCSL